MEIRYEDTLIHELPDGTKTGFHRLNMAPDTYKLFRGAVWWFCPNCRPSWAVKLGVISPADLPVEKHAPSVTAGSHQ